MARRRPLNFMKIRQGEKSNGTNILL
jgi:hypothetical protein